LKFAAINETCKIAAAAAKSIHQICDFPIPDGIYSSSSVQIHFYANLTTISV
jgi:hypothetical protein